MDSLLLQTLPVLHEMCQVFTKPTARRFLALLPAAILTQGRHTVSGLHRLLHPDADGHPSSWHRFLSTARWSSLALACVLFRHLLRLLPPDQPVTLVGDDTVTQHKGEKVHAKGRHRDPVRSSHSYTAYHYGHKWVVLAVLIRFPFTKRAWALPVLVALYRTREDNERAGRPHRTPAELMGVLLRLTLRWFPEHRFVFVGDGGYASHALARLARRNRKRLTLVSLLPADANLYEPPPGIFGQGSATQKGSQTAFSE